MANSNFRHGPWIRRLTLGEHHVVVRSYFVFISALELSDLIDGSLLRTVVSTSQFWEPTCAEDVANMNHACHGTEGTQSDKRRIMENLRSRESTTEQIRGIRSCYATGL